MAEFIAGVVINIQHTSEGMQVIINGKYWLPADIVNDHEALEKHGAILRLAETEKRAILHALKYYNWDVEATAARLMVGNATIYRRLKEWGISPRKQMKIERKRLKDLNKELIKRAAQLDDATLIFANPLLLSENSVHQESPDD